MSAYAVVVEPDGSMYEIDHKPSLEERQKAVGGDVETIPLLGPAVGWVNEEGLIHGLPLNPLATAAYQAALNTDQVGVVGPMLITGPYDGRGDDTPIPEQWLARLAEFRDTGIFQVAP